MENLVISDSLNGHRTSCRSCGEPLEVSVCDLGSTPPTNSYLRSTAAFATEKSYPLHARVCANCFLVQLDYDVAPEELFGDYAYFSSYSDSWLQHARDYAAMVTDRFGLTSDSLVVEMASNDGYLLRNFVDRKVPVLGIEPSSTVAEDAEKLGVPTWVEFFGEKCAEKVVSTLGKADLVIANNVLAHVPDPVDFVKGIGTVLGPAGVVTIEFPHLLELIGRCEFDTIYHEHYSYYSLISVTRLLKSGGIEVFDVEQLPTHGGSLRVYGCLEGAHTPVESVADMLKMEAAAGLDTIAAYTDFAQLVDNCRRTFLAFISDACAKGQKVVAYGAAAKGTTFLNFCGVSADDIAVVADRNPHKVGKWLPGCHIPIVSAEALREVKPDYVLVLPWNLADEIRQQLADFVDSGSQLVTAIPTVQILGPR